MSFFCYYFFFFTLLYLAPAPPPVIYRYTRIFYPVVALTRKVAHVAAGERHTCVERNSAFLLVGESFPDGGNNKPTLFQCSLARSPFHLFIFYFFPPRFRLFVCLFFFCFFSLAFFPLVCMRAAYSYLLSLNSLPFSSLDSIPFQLSFFLSFIFKSFSLYFLSYSVPRSVCVFHYYYY